MARALILAVLVCVGQAHAEPTEEQLVGVIWLETAAALVTD